MSGLVLSLVWPGIAITVTAVAGLLLAQYHEHRGAARICKPVASAGFLLTAVGAGGLESSYGQVMLLALLACAAGDVLLMFASSRAFLAGVGAFATGHVAFSIAFSMRGVTTWASIAALLALVPFGLGVKRWLAPHVEGTMRFAVSTYIVIIVAMVAMAIGTHVREPSQPLLFGALAFFLSDLSVARDRFVAPGFVNRAWGLPLYYGAQLLLAVSIAAC